MNEVIGLFPNNITFFSNYFISTTVMHVSTLLIEIKNFSFTLISINLRYYHPLFFLVEYRFS